MKDDRKLCHVAKVFAPGEVRWCHRELDALGRHEGDHETIFRTERRTWSPDE